MTFELPPLPFPMDALEPYLSRETLELHHGRHHAAYVTTLNELIRGTRYADRSLGEVIEMSGSGPIHNNAAQHFNHSFYWRCLRPARDDRPSGVLDRKIQEQFGSFDELTRRFAAAAAGQFGSGWAWLVMSAGGSLAVETSANASSPVGTPLLTCDVWEHAYYVDYRNDRGEYVGAFWKLVNWDFVAANLARASQRDDLDTAVVGPAGLGLVGVGRP